MEEIYEFFITYPNKKTNEDALVSIKKGTTEILQVFTKKEIKKATQQMMRTLLTLTQTLKVLFSFFLSLLFFSLGINKIK